MSFTKKGMLRGLILGMGVLLLTACGGGGGSSHGLPDGPDPNNEYQVGLTADKTHLALNINDVPPYAQWVCDAFGWGNCSEAYENGAYHAVLHVNAHRKASHDPIPGGEEVFGCNIAKGLELGTLYYMDGEHTVDVEVGDETYKAPAGFRSISLGANSGGSSFHFVSSSKAGKATIRCSATDLQSGEQAYGDIELTIGDGGGEPGQSSQVLVTVEGLNVLYKQNAVGPNQRIVQVRVVDPAGQPISDPPAGQYNLVAEIDTLASSAAPGAKLYAGSAAGQAVVTRTVAGVAQFTVSSGYSTGGLLVRFYTDRADNDVMNGTQDRIQNIAHFGVFDGASGGSLQIFVPEDPFEAEFMVPFAAGLAATGGAYYDGYTWSEVGNTLASIGLTLSPDGLVSGTPTALGTFSFVAQVKDKNNLSASAVFRITVEEGAVKLLEITTATLAAAAVNQPYAAVLGAEGGRRPYTWSGVSTNPDFAADFTVNADGSITGIPTKEGNYAILVTVTDAGGQTTSRTLTLVVGDEWVFSISPSSITAGVATTVTAAVLSGGQGPFTWAIVSGAPAGAVIAPATGAITIPNTVTAGDYTIVFSATDSSTPPRTKQGQVTLKVQ